MDFVWAFVIGGLICACGQVLVDKTRLTNARILVIFVVAGCVLTGLGLYEPLVEFAHAGATVPITGFGYALTKGVMKEIDQSGLAGVFTGALKATAGGVTAAMLFSLAASLVFDPKEK